MSFPCRLKDRGPDSREGLKAIVASFAVMLLLSAGYKAQGVFFDAALQEFNATRREISWPMSIYQFAMNFSGLILGPLAERFSIRPVFATGAILGTLGFLCSYFVNNPVAFSVTYGLMGGVSFGAAMLAASILMTQYFDKFRAVTIGLTFCGGAVGSLIFPALFSVLTTELGFHAMVAINGVICAISIPIALVLKEPSWITDHTNNFDLTCQSQTMNGARPGKTQQAGTPLREQLSVLFEGSFWLLCIPTICFYWANLACLTTIVDFYYTERDVSKLRAVNLLTAFGISEIVGQLALPHLADQGLILRETLLMINFLLGGLLLLLIPISPTYWVTITFISVLGPFYGLAATFYRCFVGDYLGIHRMKTAFGILTALKGAVLLAAPFFIGYFRDVMQDYRLMYNICGILLIAAGLVYLPVICKKRLQLALN